MSKILNGRFCRGNPVNPELRLSNAIHFLLTANVDCKLNKIVQNIQDCLILNARHYKLRTRNILTCAESASFDELTGWRIVSWRKEVSNMGTQFRVKVRKMRPCLFWVSAVMDTGDGGFSPLPQLGKNSDGGPDGNFYGVRGGKKYKGRRFGS